MYYLDNYNKLLSPPFQFDLMAQRRKGPLKIIKIQIILFTFSWIQTFCYFYSIQILPARLFA